MTTQRKGSGDGHPTEPTSSTNSRKGKPMNGTTHSTAGGNAPDDCNNLPDAVGDLFGPLWDATMAAGVASFLTEKMLGQREIINCEEVFIVSSEHGELLTWATYKSEDAIKAANAAWEEVNSLAFKMRRAS